MKKILVAAFVLSLFAAAGVTTASYAGTFTRNEQDNKTKIDVNALPEAVKQALNSDTYAGWQAVAAWQVGDIYEIELKKDDASQTVKLDKDGKPV